MKLLVLCNKMPFPPRDGSSVAIASNVRGLLGAGAEVDLLALNTVKHFVCEPQPDDPGPGLRLLDVPVDTTPTLKGAAANLLTRASYLVSRFDQPGARGRLGELLASTRYDAAIIEGLTMMHYAEPIRRRGIPVVLRAHNVEHRIWQRLARRETNPLKRVYLLEQARRLARFEEAAARNASVVAAITAEDARWFEPRASEVVVMPCGYGVLGAAPCDYETSDLYHLGSMDWLPNVDGIRWFAKSVWPRVRAGEAGARFHLAGRDSERIGLDAAIPGFQIHGPVDDAAAFIRDHGILVVPLHAGSGMRIKIIEAMAHGKPIISTRIGAEGIPLTSGHDAILADSAEAFAEAVLLLVRDAGTRRRLGGNAWRLARSEFDEAAIARRFLGRLQEVV